MSYKINITEENKRYKVVVNEKGVVYINDLKELELAIKGLKVNTEDND